MKVCIFYTENSSILGAKLALWINSTFIDLNSKKEDEKEPWKEEDSYWNPNLYEAMAKSTQYTHVDAQDAKCHFTGKPTLQFFPLLRQSCINDSKCICI